MGQQIEAEEMRRPDAPFPDGTRSGEALAPSVRCPQMDTGKVLMDGTLDCHVSSGVATSGFEVWALCRVSVTPLFSMLSKTAFGSWCKAPPRATCGLQEEMQKAARPARVALGGPRSARWAATGWGLQQQTLVFSRLWRPARGLGASRCDFRGHFPQLADGHLLPM